MTRYAIATLLCGACVPMTPAMAAGKPTSLTVVCSSVTEGETATCTVTKHGGNGRAVKIEYATADGTAKAPGDYVADSGGNRVLGSTPMTLSFRTVDDAMVENPETVTVNVRITSTGATASGTVTIADNDVAAPPPPTTEPVPPPALVHNPLGYDELPDVAPNFDVQKAIGASVIPPSNAPDVLGAFRFICAPGQLGYIDPIVSPGGRASHLHQFYGNLVVTPNSTFESLMTKGASTCFSVDAEMRDPSLAFSINRSGYWMPAMLDGKGNAIRPEYVTVYYKRRPAGDPKCSLANVGAEGNCIPLPNGLKFVFGFNMLRPELNDLAHPRFSWSCSGGPHGGPTLYNNMAAVAAFCNTPGDQIEVNVQAPGCWNGQLDSADHMSHLAYPESVATGLKCPAGYQFIPPSWILATFWTVREGDDPTKWSLSSDAMFPNLPAGSTMHADWFGAWHKPTMQKWVDNCINKLLSCAGGVFGDGTSGKGGWIAFYRHGDGSISAGFTVPDDLRLVPLSSIPTTVN